MLHTAYVTHFVNSYMVKHTLPDPHTPPLTHVPQLGVHIADVTHFVRPDTPIDAEASARATTVYLVQRRIDMLPKALTEDICSLRCAATKFDIIAVAWIRLRRVVHTGFSVDRDNKFISSKMITLAHTRHPGVTWTG